MRDYISREATYQSLTEYYHHTTEGMHSALREAINRVPAADVRPCWIPVTERLPEHDKNVLICYEWTGRSRTVYREVGIASIEELERDPTEMFRPLYWMPLPQPPKEE